MATSLSNIVPDWWDYNRNKPHSSLGNQTPLEFAESSASRTSVMTRDKEYKRAI